jgi:hypothetical protein
VDNPKTSHETHEFSALPDFDRAMRKIVQVSKDEIERHE